MVPALYSNSRHRVDTIVTPHREIPKPCIRIFFCGCSGLLVVCIDAFRYRAFGFTNCIINFFGSNPLREKQQRFCKRSVANRIEYDRPAHQFENLGRRLTENFIFTFSMKFVLSSVVTAASASAFSMPASFRISSSIGTPVMDMLIAVPFALKDAGGWANVTANIPAGTLNLFQGYDLFGIISLVVMYTATFSVGQEAVSRFYAAKNEKTAKTGAWLAAMINFIYAFIPTILGIITLALINMTVPTLWATMITVASWVSRFSAARSLASVLKSRAEKLSSKI